MSRLSNSLTQPKISEKRAKAPNFNFLFPTLSYVTETRDCKESSVSGLGEPRIPWRQGIVNFLHKWLAQFLTISGWLGSSGKLELKFTKNLQKSHIKLTGFSRGIVLITFALMVVRLVLKMFSFLKKVLPNSVKPYVVEVLAQSAQLPQSQKSRLIQFSNLVILGQVDQLFSLY